VSIWGRIFKKNKFDEKMSIRDFLICMFPFTTNSGID
jgi:hypothetical protein